MGNMGCNVPGIIPKKTDLAKTANPKTAILLIIIHTAHVHASAILHEQFACKP
jgi:hypothetical protein